VPDGQLSLDLRADRRGHALEASVPASERHGRGQYFTPEPLIELVLSLVDPPDGVVLDFACGSGRFLLGAKRFGQPLRGFETDPAALEAARSNLPSAELSAQSFLETEGAEDVALIVGNPPYVRDRGRKRDLYVDFLEHAADHLRPGGQLALVLSNAWMDVGYGAIVRELLLRRFEVQWIVEGEERWFPGAKVHTVVLIARKGRGDVVRFGRVEALPGPVETVREVTQSELRSDQPWGPHLRAPDAWFNADRASMPTLADLAEVERGFTTNDNRFYYPGTDAGIEERWLQPLLKGPKRVRGFSFDPTELPDRVFLAPADVSDPGARAWIGDREEWTLRPQTPAQLFVFKGVHDRFRSPLAASPSYFDQQVYGVRPRAGVSLEGLAAVLNSSWGCLELEMAGRVNFGEGVLWLGLKDLRQKVRLPDPRGFDLGDAWAKLLKTGDRQDLDSALGLDVGDIARSVTARRVRRARAHR
jgi:predicted RNA methylase